MAEGLMRSWSEPGVADVSPALREAIGGHPLVADTLVRRGLGSADEALAFLDPERYCPASPWELPGMERAVQRLMRAIEDREKLCVWGDFDVDGQMATTLLVETLRSLGGDVTYYIPVRATESHGIALPALERVLAQGLGLLLTCDTGVTAHAAVAQAQARGVDVVITDHHELPPSLPAAYAVLNPKMVDEHHPLRELPGVGCAYKLAEALYAQAGRPDDVEQHLDLVALGIVADVATQTRDTRYLLQRGLGALRPPARVALKAMLELAELSSQRLTEEHIGFVLAPRLNALGRLADANKAVAFLGTTDVTQARIVAAELEGLNAQRKLLTDQITQAVIAKIERDASLLESPVLVVNDSNWPPGVIGIVAGRLVARYGRPALVLLTPPGELARGSARSVPGCNITAALAANAHLLVEFGGHPMAAGLAMDAERLGEFRRALATTVLEMCGPCTEKAVLQIDGYLSLSDLSLDLVEELERMAPFGPGNPPLVLATHGLRLVHADPVGRGDEHLQMLVEDEGGALQRVIWWQGAALHEAGVALPEGRFDLAYTVRASDYRGVRAVQVEWVDARPEADATTILRPSAPEVAVVDYRQLACQTDMALRALDALRIQIDDLQVWREANPQVAGSDRNGLSRARALAIWTAPPGPEELEAALRQVAPAEVYLFGVDPGLDDANSLLSRLVGLVKYALRARGGQVSIAALAAATAQREVTVRAGVAWLADLGYVDIQRATDEVVELQAGTQPGQVAGAVRVPDDLRWLLEDTAAYRRSFRRARAESLVAKAGEHHGP